MTATAALSETATRAVTLPCSRCGKPAGRFTPPLVPTDIRGFLGTLTRIPLIPPAGRLAIALFLTGETDRIPVADVAQLLAVECAHCVTQGGAHGH